MNNLTLLEILVVASTTIQLFSILTAFYIYLIRDKYIWIWVIVAMVVTFLRRVFAMYRYCTGTFTLELEYALTLVVTICWIIFMVKIIMKDTIKKVKL